MDWKSDKGIQRSHQRRDSVTDDHERLVFPDLIAPVARECFQQRRRALRDPFNQRNGRFRGSDRQQEHRHHTVDHFDGGIGKEAGQPGKENVFFQSQNFIFFHFAAILIA